MAVKSSKVRWAGYVAHVERCKMHTKCLLGKPKGRRSIDGKIILEWILERV
jgi:hypothetical protein